MTTKACIKLKKEANEATRARFYEAIEILIDTFERGTPLFGTKKTTLRKSKPRVSSDEPVYPITVVGRDQSIRDVVWFSIANSEYVQYFESLARLHLERGFVGDKYKILVNPELSDI